jgi:putative hemin transport protein
MLMTTEYCIDPPSALLDEAWQKLRQAEPRLRIRDAAERLGVSELELLALRCGQKNAWLCAERLSGNWGELIRDLPKLGQVMALTRNRHAVHEKHGFYKNISINGDSGLVLAGAIDLRLFLRHWRFGFAVIERDSGAERHSLQFFDRHGDAVHKIYLTEFSRRSAYEDLVERYAAADQSARQAVEPRPFRGPEHSDASRDRTGLLEEWRRLKDTHDFFPMLRRWDVGRLQALRLADRDMAFPVAGASAEYLLAQAAEEEIPVMIFVGSPGVIQIHTGPLRNLRRTGPWINVLDEDFNLHLRDECVASSWVVRKPTTDGVVTSLELFDAQGELIAQFFGERKPGAPELGVWRDLVNALPPTDMSAYGAAP